MTTPAVRVIPESRLNSEQDSSLPVASQPSPPSPAAALPSTDNTQQPQLHPRLLKVVSLSQSTLERKVQLLIYIGKLLHAMNFGSQFLTAG